MIEEMGKIDKTKCSQIVDELIRGAKLALAELDHVGGDYGVDALNERFRERILATEVLSRAVRDAEKGISEGLK